jgi:hypothetical protein
MVNNPYPMLDQINTRVWINNQTINTNKVHLGTLTGTAKAEPVSQRGAIRSEEKVEQPQVGSNLEKGGMKSVNA